MIDVNFKYNKTSTENNKNIDKPLDEQNITNILLQINNEGDNYSALVQDIKNCIREHIQNVAEKQQINHKVIFN